MSDRPLLALLILQTERRRPVMREHCLRVRQLGGQHPRRSLGSRSRLRRATRSRATTKLASNSIRIKNVLIRVQCSDSIVRTLD